MRENCTYGSEGGGIELNRSFLPLSGGNAVPPADSLCHMKVSEAGKGHGARQAER